jgi:septal ring factor EnvC (AmiA/AmiB activator)
MKKYLFTIIVFFASIGFVLSQDTKADLERERKEIQDELKAMQAVYDKIKGQKNQSLTQLNMLKRKISLQERYISTINKELRNIDDDIYRGNLEIYRLGRQLDTLKAEYARTIVYAYKNRSNFDYVNFIFSATNFNDALRRIAYLKSYRAYRERQVSTINETQELIVRRQKQQLARKEEKNKALQNQTTQRNELAEQRKEKDAVVSKLKSQENDLAKQIAAKKKRDKELQNAITAVVRREIEAAKKAEEDKRKAANVTSAPVVTSSGNKTNATAATNTPASRPESYLEVNAGDIKLGADFTSSKGKLPWPVDNAFVKVPYGRYTIEGTTLFGDNPGITIGTPKGSPVKAVFDGEVSLVNNTGEGYMVVIRHGKYYTTYSNLATVNVKKGAKVSSGQVIGTAGSADDDSGGQIDFVLMIELNKANPSQWLRR